MEPMVRVVAERREAAGPAQSNVLQIQTTGPGKVMSLLAFSSKALGAAAAAPYEPGKLAVPPPPPYLCM